MHRARAALDRYGAAKAIVLARVIPLVRTVLNPLAGTVGVPVRTFTAWQVAGGLLCSLGVTLAGYALGSRIPNVDRYLLPIVAVIVVVSLIPTAGRHRRHRPAPIGLFDPAARRREALAGERGEADRNRDRRWGMAGRGRAGLCLSGLPVRPSCGGPGRRQPVQRDVVHDALPGEPARGRPPVTARREGCVRIVRHG